VQHPTASLIARAATAQDDITGDGTTSIVLLIGELLKQADLYIAEVALCEGEREQTIGYLDLQGLHPRIVAEGFELAKKEALSVLDQLKIPMEADRQALIPIARTSLRTKLPSDSADILTDVRRDFFSV
jgi:T-complex protein 1 subunit zeta